jgi:type IV secretion system protein VirB6
MIGCAATAGAPSLARDVLANADCLISAQVEAGYAALLAPGGGFVVALTLGLTIYVAVIGYRLILGHAGLSLGEMVPHFIKIGVVLALATRWPSYQTLVFDLLFHGPEQLAAPILRQVTGSAAGQGDVLAALQAVFDRLTDYASAAWTQPSVAPLPVTAAPALLPGTLAPPPAPSLPLQLGAPQFVGMLLWISALVMLATSLGVLLVVRIILALLLVLGPVFIALALFPSTRGLFEGWLRMAVKFALVPLFTLPLTAAMVAVLIPFAADLGDGHVTSLRDGPVLAIALIVLVFAAVMLQVTRLTAGIASGIRLPRRTMPVSQSVAAAGMPTRARLSVPPLANRADILVQSLGGGRNGEFVTGLAAPEAILATRRIAAPESAGVTVVDSGARLGQGYRRLAISAPARAIPNGR